MTAKYKVENNTIFKTKRKMPERKHNNLYKNKMQ